MNNEDIQCYKIWYMANSSKWEAVPEDRKAYVTKLCREDCGCFLVKCRDQLKELILTSSEVKIEEKAEEQDI